MATTKDIAIPDLGDFDAVEVIEILVKVGDSIAREDSLITLETDKATMDVPAADNGVISALTVAVGDKVASGDVIGRLEPAVSDTVIVTPAIEAEVLQGDTTVVATPLSATAGGLKSIAVPDIGDFDSVEVIEVHIKSGDAVQLEDPLITLETDKAAMDVPSTAAGTVDAVLVKVGDKVSAGIPIAVVDEIETATVVSAAKAENVQVAQTPAPVAQASAPAPEAVADRQLSQSAINERDFSRAHASPSVRKLARELGVDLVRVKGSGAKQRVLHEDVKAFVKSVLSGVVAPREAAGGLPALPKVDYAAFGEIEVQPLTRIQKISGPRLQASWVNLPHVTQHDLADITELEAKRQELKGAAKQRGISLTPLAFIMKACIAVLREFPKVNASLSNDGASLVYKHYYHLGFAADTNNGLMVPVIRDADKMDVYELAGELGELSRLARDGKLAADQLQGASFTVYSLGGIGGTAFTPIVNALEVAILGVSRSSIQPVWSGDAFEPRLMLPLSLSYDHRVVDGAYAVRFTTALSQALSDIDSLLRAIT